MATFGFSVYEDDENARSNFDKPLKETSNVSAKVPLQKRAVLGLLSNNPEYKKRIQPNRTTKQVRSRFITAIQFPKFLLYSLSYLVSHLLHLCDQFSSSEP